MRVPAFDARATGETRTYDTVDLVVDGGWRLAVRTLVADPSGTDDVALVPVGHHPVIPGGRDSCDATLEWRSPRGLVRREGVLRLGPEGFVLAAADEAVIMQRRNFARVRCAVRVAVLGEASDGELLTRTVDLSVGGMLVEQAAMLEIDEQVRFTLNLSDDTVVSGEGRVVRATPFGHRAIRFEPFVRADEQQVARFVFAQEREGRSAAAYG